MIPRAVYLFFISKKAIVKPNTINNNDAIVENTPGNMNNKEAAKKLPSTMSFL